MLGLAYDYVRHPEEQAPAAEARPGYVPLRVMPTSSAQPAGPTPSKRHQKLGVGPHVLTALPGAVTLPEAPDPDQPEANVRLSSLEVVTPKAPAASAPAASTPAPAAAEAAGSASAPAAEVKGDSNVATVDEVTRDDKSVENAETSPDKGADSATTSDTGLVVEKEPDPAQGEVSIAVASQVSEAEAAQAVASEEAAPAAGGDLEEAEPPASTESAPAAPEAPPSKEVTASDKGKAKKGKRKGAKEKK